MSRRRPSSNSARALGLRRGRLRWRRRWLVGAGAAVGHELVELGLVLGGAQLVEELAEFALILLEAAQGLLAIFVEGDVAARGVATPAVLPGLVLVARAHAVRDVPTAGVAVLPATHAPTSFHVEEDGQPDRPEEDEAGDHQGDPGGLAPIVEF